MVAIPVEVLPHQNRGGRHGDKIAHRRQALDEGATIAAAAMSVRRRRTMLFNSYPFLLVFLPTTVLGYFLLGHRGKTWGAAWLAGCSLFFYGWWDYHYVALLLISICVNFYAGSRIARHAGSAAGRRMLTLAVTANLLLLGYFKYADFFIGSANGLLGTRWPALSIILPIGISFFTFTQIAFLVDAYAGKVKEYRFVYYLLFVSYFPHLIAGPVLHHKEMMPQFDQDENYHPHADNFAVGMTMFAIGLAKKVLIADSLAPFAAPLFDPHGDAPTLFLAWGGALAYTLQLYFDFSGYSDMAIGLSRIFGVRLPLNFNSPYKSANIVEFWRRWHMTLSRFLRDYLYIPMGGNRNGPVRRHVYLMITMLLGGLWHGAGWNFVIWGGLHGLFLIVNHGWRDVCSRWSVRVPMALSKATGITLTFVCVVFAWVYFRAPDLATANRVAAGMLGHWGTALPSSLTESMGPFGAQLGRMGINTYLGGGAVFVQTWAWVVVGLAIAFFAPNSQEIMPVADESTARRQYRALWQPQPAYAVLAGLVLALGVLALNRPTEFLYFQF
jgi:alginate O-acetyltransferase complex protein AlgI